MLVRWPEKAQQSFHRDPIRRSSYRNPESGRINRLASSGESPASSPLGRNVDSAGGNQVDPLHFTAQSNRYESRFLGRLGNKSQPVLMLQAMRELVQIRRKRHRRAGEPDVIRFASCLVGQLRQVHLTPVVLPVTVSEVTNSRRVDRGNDDPGSDRIANGGVQVGILDIPCAIKTVHSIADQKGLMARL